MASRDKDVQSRGVRRVLWITLVLNVAVSAGKVVVGYTSGSLAMVADGYHSLVDGSNNVLGLIVAAFAFAPPDRSHPYGHRKFESAATAIIGAALLALAWQVAAATVARPTSAPPPAIGPLNWAVMAVTIATNVLISWFEAREGRRLGSAFLIADATHTRADLVVSLGVVASFVAAMAGLGWADPLVAVVIAVTVAWQAVRILRSAFNVLTDRAAIAPERLENLASAVQGVRQVHGVRTRGWGDVVHVDLTVHLEGSISLQAAHDVADRIEAELREAHPEIVDVVVHVEPEGHEEASSRERMA